MSGLHPAPFHQPQDRQAPRTRIRPASVAASFIGEAGFDPLTARHGLWPRVSFGDRGRGSVIVHRRSRWCSLSLLTFERSPLCCDADFSEGFGMSLALEQIFDGYVRLNDREALADLKAHREDLLAQLRAQLGGWFDVSRSVSQMEEDVTQIEAGLARLDGAVASPPSGSDAAHLS
jgi:hypothetical protein